MLGRRLQSGIILLSLAFFPSVAYANAGIPMLLIAWPVFGIALIPVVIIEWLVMKKNLSHLGLWKLFRVTFYSNSLSTLLGIPLAWFVMLALQFVVSGDSGGIAWLPPPESLFPGVTSLTFLVLLVPFFIVSYWMEKWVTCRLLKKMCGDEALVTKSVWRGNIYSYGFLALLTFICLLYEASF